MYDSLYCTNTLKFPATGTTSLGSDWPCT